MKVGDFVYVSCRQSFGIVTNVEDRGKILPLIFVRMKYDPNFYSSYGIDRFDESWCKIVDEEWAQGIRGELENWISKALALAKKG